MKETAGPGFVERWGAFGNLPADDDRTRLHKSFLIYMALLMSGGGLLWGTISVIYEIYWQAVIPYGYTFMTAVNLAYFAWRKNFAVVRFFQILFSLLLPFVFQWALGGFAVTGAIMLWSLVALVGSITFQSIRAAAAWLGTYLGLALLSGIVDPFVRVYALDVSPAVSNWFFVVNIMFISAVVVGLMLYFVYSRDRANDELTQLTDHLEEMVESRTRELKETLAHLTAIIDNIADGLLVTDVRGRITRINPALTNMYRMNDRRNFYGREALHLDPAIADLLARTLEDREIHAEEIDLPDRRVGKAVTTGIVHEDEDSGRSEFLGTVSLIRDITREKEIDTMKTDFISNVSHELRTPLTSVLGFAKIINKKFNEVVRPGLDLSEKQNERAARQIGENLGIIIAEGERLTTLINSVLDISKMEAGKTEWRMERLQPADLIEHACSATASLFKGGPVRLEQKIAAGVPEIVADRDRIIQVLINLISNAGKFTREGRVTVEAAPDEFGLRVSVTDTGTGISAEDQAKVFDKFQQVGDTLTDKPHGTGLGLPICKQIVDHHQGRIWVESEPGRGSRFSFVLPLEQKEAGDPDALADRVGRIKRVDLDSLIADLNRHVPERTASPAAAPLAKTILITDDDPAIRSMLRQELEEAGYNALEAENGMEAVKIVKARPVDLVILDIMMPKMNGFDVAAVIKNDPDTMRIPILVYSVVADEERGYRLGVDKYVMKSNDTAQILEEVAALLEQGPSRKKVLILDENQGVVRSLVDVLRARGYEATGAFNGEEGIAKAISERPDMVIVDSLLSEKHDLVKTLRFNKGLENLYFLLLGEKESIPAADRDGDVQPKS